MHRHLHDQQVGALLGGGLDLLRRAVVQDARPPWGRMRDFVYFYDFYVVSAALLTVLVIYLIAS